MKQEAVLIEAVALADEILDSGPGDGRGFRLAGLVHRLNEAMMRGDSPLSWRPPVPPKEVLASIPPPPPVPSSLPRAGASIDWDEFAPPPLPEPELPSPEDLDDAWDQLFSTAPPEAAHHPLPARVPGRRRALGGSIRRRTSR